jgi:hypothetical protein
MVDMHTRRARGVLVVLAVCWALMGHGFWSVRLEDPFLPALWGPLFWAASITTLWLAATLRRVPLFFSMILLVVGFAGRIFATYARMVEDQVSAGRVAVAAGVFTALFILVANAWIRVLGPIVSWHEQKKGTQ